MTTKDEALRMALEAMELALSEGNLLNPAIVSRHMNKAITACREALAQPAGEPPTSLGADRYFYEAGYNAGTRAALLSSDAQPSEWVGLSDDAWKLAKKKCGLLFSDVVHMNRKQVEAFARAIEAKLREKNARKDMPDAKGAPKGCHRSHPHENMNEACELKSQIARLEAGIRYRDEVIQQRNTMLSATYAKPASEDKAGGDEPVASIYVTPSGEREFDDWNCPLPAGRNVLYTHPQPQADEPLAWLYEDSLPSEYPYDAMFPHSAVIDGVRMFPVFSAPLTN